MPTEKTKAEFNHYIASMRDQLRVFVRTNIEFTDFLDTHGTEGLITREELEVFMDSTEAIREMAETIQILRGALERLGYDEWPEDIG